MLFKKSERKRMNPYVTMAIGTLAVIGAVSIVRCGKRMVRHTCDKMTCMVRQVMNRNEVMSTEE